MNQMSRLALVAAVLGVVPPSAFADDDTPAFDRPGLAFATGTVAPDACVWEQGLPDASTDRSDRVRTSTYLADTLVHCGLSASLELQLGADSRGWQELRDAASPRRRESGGGDARLGLKAAIPGSSDAFSLAVLATFGVPVGRAPIGDNGYTKDVGASMAWSAGTGRSVSLYLDHHWGRDGQGSLGAVAYAFPLRDRLSGYIETGFGDRALHAREAGGGLVWMATPRIQLDVSFLRALDRATTDWQAGLGISVYIAGTRS